MPNLFPPDLEMTIISVIIPFYKDIPSLRSACESVIHQEIEDLSLSFELVICNDSHFDKEHILTQLSLDIETPHSLVIVDNVYPRGPGGNRNSGIDASCGSIICFLDSDDLWHPKKVFYQYKLILSGSNFVSCHYRFCSSNFSIKSPRSLSGKRSIFLSRNPLGTSTIMITRDLLGDLRFPQLYFCQDIVLWSWLLSIPFCKYSFVDLPLTIYSLSGRTSSSSAIEILSSYMLALRYAKIDLFFALIALIIYVFRGLYNKSFRRIFDRTHSPMRTL